MSNIFSGYIMEIVWKGELVRYTNNYSNGSMHSLEKIAFEALMNSWKTYVNQESRGGIIQPQNTNKPPVMPHSLSMSRIKHPLDTAWLLKELSVA